MNHVYTCAGIRALLLECTELPPYGDALRYATGLPTYDAITTADAFIHGFMDNPRFGELGTEPKDHHYGSHVLTVDQHPGSTHAVSMPEVTLPPAPTPPAPQPLAPVTQPVPVPVVDETLRVSAPGGETIAPGLPKPSFGAKDGGTEINELIVFNKQVCCSSVWFVQKCFCTVKKMHAQDTRTYLLRAAPTWKAHLRAMYDKVLFYIVSAFNGPLSAVFELR